MDIRGDDFIELLYLSESDERIIKMREMLNAPKPLLDKRFKEDGYVSIELEGYHVEIFFTDKCKLQEKDTGPYVGDILFSNIIFYSKTNIQPPLNLKFGISYSRVVEILGRTEDYRNKRLPKRSWVFERKDGKLFLINTTFKENNCNELQMLGLATDDSIRVLENSRFVERLKP